MSANRFLPTNAPGPRRRSLKVRGTGAIPSNNLLDNAAKYSPTETTIRIQSWRTDAAVQLRVLDEGPGIPTTELDHIFDKFYRVQKADQVRAGTGLGLAISRGFIEAMHGIITAANRTDRSGAAFTITLPIPRGRQIMDTAA